MATAQEIKAALSRVHDLTSLVKELLGNPDVLQGPIEERIEDPQKITYGWTAEELNAQGLEKQLLDGEVRQIRPFRSDQPWSIFLVEFAHGQVFRTALRWVGSRQVDPACSMSADVASAVIHPSSSGRTRGGKQRPAG